MCNIQPRKGNERVVKQREMRGLAGRETVVALPDTEVVRQEGTIAAGIGQSRLGPEEQQARYMCGRLHHRCISARVLLLMNNEVGERGNLIEQRHELHDPETNNWERKREAGGRRDTRKCGKKSRIHIFGHATSGLIDFLLTSSTTKGTFYQ